MQNTSKNILILYIRVGSFQVMGILLKIPFIHLSLKVLLMPLLILYLWHGKEVKSNYSLFRLSLLALLFSYLGDIVLMIPGDSPLYFISGLVSFLMAHLCYIKLFFSLSPLNKNRLKKNPIWITGIILFLAVFLSYLVPKVDNTLKIPVITYAFILCSMLISTLHLKENMEKGPHSMIVLGAVLFVLSDSFLALNKFDPLFGGVIFLHALVMITYISAQGFIIHGIKLYSLKAK
jgi:uncharacterized membrane protein YhhN